ncbi:MAG: hypothetical protein C5B50_21250 [Verrucomicrobia bacterium]|nr:MAG: hypothetical protein C5B50_21250 [Verrucomicrobiota bacterium]
MGVILGPVPKFNQVLVTGPGSLWTNRSAVAISDALAAGGFHQLTVSNGAAVLSGGAGNVGGTGNQLLITGPGSRFANQLDFTLGGSANNLQVSQGAGFICSNTTVGSLFPGDYDSILVTDAGSFWTNRGDLTMGLGPGIPTALVASNGASVFTGGNAIIASGPNSIFNRVSITDPGTSWLVGGTLLVGSNGPYNSLVVSNGAKLYNGRDALIGAWSGAGSNSVLITDAGSSWTNGEAHTICVGSNSSFNRLVISNAAIVQADAVDVSLVACSNNQVVVTGPGSLLKCVVLDVGDTLDGNQLVISNGATVCTTAGSIGGNSNGHANEAVVTGAGSLWTNFASLYVGPFGDGNRLVITNNGEVIAPGGLSVGASSSSKNHRVIVDGGKLRVTNGIGTAVLNIISGTNALSSGLIDADQLILTNRGANVVLTAFANTNGTSIPSSGSASPYPSTITVSGFEGSITKVTVTLVNLSHNAPADLDILLVSPGGQKAMIMSDAGGSSSIFNQTLTFDDAATSTLSQFSPISSGTYQPVDYEPGDVMPPFAPSGPYPTALSSFNGASPNGVWSLYIADDSSGNAGTLLGWSLQIATDESSSPDRGSFEFDGGTLITRGAAISNGFPVFVVGGPGNNPAVWDVRAGLTNHSVSGDLVVGKYSSFNQLIVTNGALLTNSGISANGILGQNTGANSNSVTLAGPGSQWLLADGLTVGGFGSGNRLVLSNGASLVTGSSSSIGNQLVSSNNEIVVAGPGSSWTSPLGFMFIGGGKNNRLSVFDGGQVTSYAGKLGVSFLDSSNNLAVVAGSGSSWSNATELRIGETGPRNQLVVSNNGVVFAGNAIYVGVNPNSTNNRVTVDGGTLRATNVSTTGLLDLRRGTTFLNSGLIETDVLIVSNYPASQFVFNGGTLSIKSLQMFPGVGLNVGNGTNTATLFLAGNGLQNVNGVTVNANATLTGNGTITGPVVTTGTASSGGTISPGTSIGKLLFLSSPSLGGTVFMEISKNGVTLTNDQIQVNNALPYNGGLTVTNIGSTALAVGDRFQLFSATSYSGSFYALSLPPLTTGLDWTNKLIVDGSIQVILSPPTDRVWTNIAGGNYDVAANWLSNTVPASQDTANFISNATYRVDWPSSALAANAVFNAGGGSVTQAIGGSSWTLTNSYVVGRDPAATAAVNHISGRLNVTNSAATAQLIIGQAGFGSYNLAGGEVVADTLLATNGPSSVFNFSSGALRARNTTNANGLPLVIGNGASPATFELLGNNAYVSVGTPGLIVSSNGALTGNGSLAGQMEVKSGGQLRPGTSIGKISLSNPPLLSGTVMMEISNNPDGSGLTNDQIQVAGGTFTYGGALIVTNLGPTALANGDKFQLFSATSFTGAFTSITLPPLGAGLSWKTNLLVDGSIQVAAPPAIPISRGAYAQNFDSLGTNDSLWRDNSTLLGWYAAKTITLSQPLLNSYSASDGIFNAGSLYSFGSFLSPERALGSIASDNFGNVAYGLCFTNDFSASVSNFNITYTGEQWRNGGGGSVTNVLTFWYQVSLSVITNPEPDVVSNWTQVTNLSFASPVNSGGGPGGSPLDGNQAGNRHIFSSVLIPGLVVPPGRHIFFRWRDLNDSGTDMGMALDDLLISFSALAPQITSASINPTNGFLQIFGLGESNHLYAIQAATNLVPPIVWQPLGSNTSDPAGLFYFIDTNAPSLPARFYRALSP